MAKRLNKKVAIIGSLFLALLILAAIVVVLNLSRDPQKYIKDAQAALALEEPDYKIAEKAYGRAFAYSKKTELKIDIMFKLADMYLDMNEWPKAAGCWNKIINFDTKNLKARLAMLDYSYQLANSGNWPAWKEVESNVSELIEKQLDTSPRMYRMKGQALLELVRRGQMTDKEKSINDTIEILQKAIQTEPNNADVYQYMADAIIQKGEILAARGILNSVENARQEADKVLLKGIEALPNEPKVYINLYSNKLIEAKEDPNKIKEVESKIIQLTQKFSDSPLPYFALSQLYQRDPRDIDKAIVSVEKSRQLDKQNVSYALTVASLYYRKYLADKDLQNFQNAIDIATEALGYPDSLDVPGPKARTSFINRYSLHTFLANCYLERTSVPLEGQTETSNWLELAEKEVHQINQLLGSAENPYSVMWRGRILLAKGQKNEAIKQMYSAYQSLTVSSQTQSDPQLGLLAYELAKALQNTPETGIVGQFYLTAFANRMYYNKPEMLLDFASSLIRIQDWERAIQLIDMFDKNFTENNESKNLRISAYIGAKMYDKAKESLDKLSEDDPNVLRLKNLLLNARANVAEWELIQNQPAEGQQLQQNEQYQQIKTQYEQIRKESSRVRDKLVAIGAAKVTDAEFADLCKRYIADKEYEKAAAFVDNYQVSYPNSINAGLYKLMLKEPSPVNIPPERNEQIILQTLEAIKDSVQSMLALGQFYQVQGKNEQAVEYYQKALQIAPDNSTALTNLFSVMLSQQDFSQAQKLVEIARKNNTDLCGGEFFKARLAFASKEYQTAIERINDCLEKRPIFSEAYLLRSQAYSAIEKENDAIEDAKKAYSLNPLDGNVTRNLAYMLYSRSEKLGASATIEQISETRSALELAIRANPSDFNLRSFYSQFISQTEPDRAIAISQQIQKVRPTMENSLRLGALAMRVAQQNKAQKDVYFAIAENAYKTAYELAPDNISVLEGYSEYFRINGKPDEAEKLLASNDNLLWRFYVRNGKMDDAQKVLTKLYETNPQDVNTLRGLLLVSRGKNDQAGILKYSADLLKVNESLDNEIIQVESYLEAGLADEAKTQLESLREKYPDEPRLIFLQAWQIARQGKMEDALKLVNRNLELDRNNPRVWRLRGQINLAMNKYNEAIEDLQKSKLLSDNAEIRIDLARAYARTNRDELAIAELKLAVDEQGSIIARNMLEEMYLKTGNIERLQKFYSEAIGKFPNSVYWYNRAGEFALNVKSFDEAYKLFDIAFQNSLKINSEEPDLSAFDGKMRSMLLSKKYDQLLAEATKHLDGVFAPIAYERMAEAKAYTGDKETAIQYFRRALEKAGTNENYIVEILRIMNNVVGFDETIKWCNEKLQSQPDSLAVNLALFNLYNMNQQYNKAIEYVDNCIRIAVDNERIRQMCQTSKAGILLAAFNKTSDKEYLKKAIEEYESILQEQPTNITVMNNLAYIYAEYNIDLDKAVEYGEKAYKAVPNNEGVLDTYGYVLLKKNRAAEADEFLQRSLQQYELKKMNAPVEVYEHIAMVKEKLGRNNEALDAYKRAIEVAGKNVSQDDKDRISAAIERLSSKK
ncbi:MAG: tetratricopeptide repeat protein [Phycisphaerae bacterium]|jgi:tetratricopeptide (TPR) repeat protein